MSNVKPESDADQIIRENVPLRMVRHDWRDLPNHSIDPPYRIRMYEPGDDQSWMRIHRLADQYTRLTPDLFAREFGRDHALLQERQAYLLDASGLPIGTASAWLPIPELDPTIGRIHWVAIIPEHQGKGLAKPLLAFVMRTLCTLGYRGAMLRTSSARVAAVSLYLSFGFEPWPSTPNEEAAWRVLRPHIQNQR